MPHIIRDAEFKTLAGDGLWPGMWVHSWFWQHKRAEPSPLNACYLWRVEQHDGVMLLAGQGADVLVSLTPELAEEVVLIQDQRCELLFSHLAEWALLRKLGWGVYLHDYLVTYKYQHRLSLFCQRGNDRHRFSLPYEQEYELEQSPQILPTFLATCAWRLKHPRYANALAGQHPREFWDWPNVPDVKQLHAMGQAAFRTEEGSVEIGPDGLLKATGRRAWGFPSDEQENQ
jgi:hypothetical protein